ncbi:MAG TPA: phytanoyl-CoA dioxygenase family protein [Acidimicrobiales bacterium]|nr:phytanoyl-CoA dioxygenase family protein [Acidimicrobiales bacterium]
MKRLSEPDVEGYRRDGFVALDRVLEPAFLVELQQVTATMEQQAAGAAGSGAVFDIGGGGELRRIKSPHLQHRAYARALLDDAVLDCVEDLIGTAIRFWAGKLNLKQPHGGQAVEWHQDWAFGPATNDDLLTVGITLDDASSENGCLLVLPGSHRGPLRDHWRNGQFVGAVADGALDAAPAVALELPAGSISLHHVRTLHASAPNTSSRSRRLLLYTYAAADAWPLTGIGDRASFDRQMLRGVAPAAPRLERVPVAPWPRWEDEELGADTSIFDFQDRFGVSTFAG